MQEVTTEKKEFTPNIVAFCCNWCSYAGADLAGSSRLTYPANVKIIRVPCSCRVNPAVCQGCGACTVTCPSGAMDLKGFSSKQIMSEVEAICKK